MLLKTDTSSDEWDLPSPEEVDQLFTTLPRVRARPATPEEIDRYLPKSPDEKPTPHFTLEDKTETSTGLWHASDTIRHRIQKKDVALRNVNNKRHRHRYKLGQTVKVVVYVIAAITLTSWILIQDFG